MDQQTHFLKYTKVCMILVGIMEPKFSNPLLSHVHRTWAILILGWYLLFCLSFIVGMWTQNDLLGNDDMTHLWSLLILTVKIVFAQTDTMRKVIDEMFKLESGIDKGDEEVNKKYLKQSRYNFKIFWVSSCVYSAAFCQLLWILKYNWSQKTLFYLAWYPFDRNNYYMLTFVFQTVSPIIILCYILTFDTFFTAIILFPSMLLNILGHKFKHFGDYCKKQPDRPELVLRRLIMEHQAIIRYVEKLDSFLKWFFFIDFLVKSYHLSMVVISLITEADGMNLVYDITILFFWSLQAWSIYYHGNELIIESLNISNNIFESNWYENDLVVKRMLMIIMLRSRKPLELHIGVFQPLSNKILVKNVVG